MLVIKAEGLPGDSIEHLLLQAYNIAISLSYSTKVGIELTLNGYRFLVTGNSNLKELYDNYVHKVSS